MDIPKIIFTVTVFFLLVPAFSPAHDIYLKNGTVISTEWVNRGGGHVTYHQFGGSVTIPFSQVEKIVFTPEVRHTTQTIVSTTVDGEVENGPEEDLALLLETALKPRTPVERANLAVVSITTSAGFGSGFFISADGLIVTNRHVVRGSEDNTKKIKGRIKESWKQLDQWKEKLDSEKKRIDRFARKLNESRKDLQKTVRENGARVDRDRLKEAERSLREKEDYLRDWRADYTNRLQKYKENRRDLTRKSEDFHRKNKDLSQQSRFRITLADGSEKSALLYRVSNDFDLALLKLNGYRTPFLPAADGGKLALGQRVFAIGSPLQLKNSVTSGVISNFRDRYIQTNAEIYPGNSGGPLVTENGQVLGVNTMKMITEKFEGLGFAIAISYVTKEFSEYFGE